MVISMLAVTVAVVVVVVAAAAAGEREGDLERTESGDEGAEGEGVCERSERGDVGGEVWWRAGEAIAREWLPVWQAIDALQDFVRVIQSQDRLGRRKGDKKGCAAACVTRPGGGRWSLCP